MKHIRRGIRFGDTNDGEQILRVLGDLESPLAVITVLVLVCLLLSGV